MSYVVTVKSTAEISQKFVAFSKYIIFKKKLLNEILHVTAYLDNNVARKVRRQLSIVLVAVRTFSNSK